MCTESVGALQSWVCNKREEESERRGDDATTVIADNLVDPTMHLFHTSGMTLFDPQHKPRHLTLTLTLIMIMSMSPTPPHCSGHMAICAVQAELAITKSHLETLQNEQLALQNSTQVRWSAALVSGSGVGVGLGLGYRNQPFFQVSASDS